MAAAFYFSIPGPKMIWEFGELGYDYSRCYQSTNGEGGDCNKKLDPKPIRWDYQLDAGRKRQFEIYSALLKLRKAYPNTFTSGAITSSLNSAFKSIQITHNDLSLAVVGNFDVTPVNGTVTLQNSGTWYNYLTGEPFTATGAAQSFSLAPGEYKFLVNKNVVNAVVTGVNDLLTDVNQLQLAVFPNPVNRSSQVVFTLPANSNVNFRVIDLQGRIIATKNVGRMIAGRYIYLLNDLFPLSGKLNTGVYFMEIDTNKGRSSQKIIF